jgi:hypothetical protein
VELVYIICQTAPEKENGIHQFPRSRPVTGASGLHACRSASALEWQKVRFRQLLRQPALPPVPCRSDSGNARFSDAGFQNFSYDAWDVDSAGSHDRQYDRCRVEYSLARFVAIADVVPPAKARKWLPPVSKKPASLVLA